MSWDMEWFDTHLGANVDAEGPLGTAGLMVKFNRETDEVRTASSLASGNLLQHLTITLTCLILAFTRSSSLSLFPLTGFRTHIYRNRSYADFTRHRRNRHCQILQRHISSSSKPSSTVAEEYHRDLEAPPSSLDGGLERDEGGFRKMHGEEERERLRYRSIDIRPLTFGSWMGDIIADLTSDEITEHKPTWPSSHVPDPPILQEARIIQGRKLSLQFTPTSPTFSIKKFEEEQEAVERNGVHANRMRRDRTVVKQRWDQEKADKSVVDELKEDEGRVPLFWTLFCSIFFSVPYKPLLFFGLGICLLSGAMTPVFSFLLSRLLFEVSTGAKNVSTINRLDGPHRIMVQNPKILMKDGDDARNLIAVVWGQCLVVIAMLGVGLIWALVRGWQFTFVGFAIAPIFAGAMALQMRLVAKCEIRNKRAREAVARGIFMPFRMLEGFVLWLIIRSYSFFRKISFIITATMLREM
ncbi:hypothetical protein BDQ17DRAFT_1545084 [Cyathus striatus]|nr:hypothetical protein BDQ17DRAFT_1545084 [Cyathus striatus]